MTTAPLAAQQLFTIDKFAEQVLAYQPVPNAGVPDADFKHGLFILGKIREATENDPVNFNVADYLNVLFAFESLREPEAHLRLAVQQIVASSSACEYLVSFQRNIDKLENYPVIQADWAAAHAACGDEQPVAFDEAAYVKQYDLDANLIRTIRQIEADDQRYRKDPTTGWAAKQTPLDRQNLQRVEALCAQNGDEYLGRSLVGPRLETVMWAVIQHSTVETMEQYLPLVQSAVSNEELSREPARMLVDRILWLRHGYQLYGSQLGVPVIEEPQRSMLRKQYGLD